MDYIDRKAAYTLAKRICDAIDSKDFQRFGFGGRILDWIDDLPAADVAPVVHGRWEKVLQNADGTSDYVCTACKGIIIDVPDDDEHPLCNYCPNCGAKMNVEEYYGVSET